jgi:hypothetical protein
MAGFGTFASFFFQKLLKQHSENKKKKFYLCIYGFETVSIFPKLNLLVYQFRERTSLQEIKPLRLHSSKDSQD